MIPQTLDPGGIQSNFKGISYQVKLILLAVIKSFKISTITDFQVTTEIKEANPFDDAIVELSDGTTRYIQCKHKDNPTELDLNYLIKGVDKKNKKNYDFHLPKYFAGYIKFKEKFKKSGDFAICTTNYLPDPPILSDGSNKISFVKHTGSDVVFGMFNNYFKFDLTCTETKSTIRRKLIRDLREETVDKYLDGFLSELLFVLDFKRNDIDKEIEVFVQNHFKWPEIDSFKWSLMSILYSWIENMRTVVFIKKQDFKKYLEEIEAKCITNPIVIDRSLALLRSSDFEFEACGTVKDFVKKVEIYPAQQKFYMQMKENDTFYGSCMINQEQKVEPFRFLFLSTKSSFDISDGLKFFSLENCFNILVFVENTKQPIEDRHKDEIEKILTSNVGKKLLIITDHPKSKFKKDLLADDENLLTMPKTKLSYLKQGSLKKFLDKKELKFQDETVTFDSILDSSDQNLIDEINLSDLENTDSIGHNVTSGKNFDPDLYVSRNLFHRHAIKGEILTRIRDALENEETVTDEHSFDTQCRHYPDANVHLLVPQAGGNLRWEKTRGQIDFLFNYLIPEQGTLIQNPWDSQITADENNFVLSDVPGMGKTSWLNHLAKELKKNDHYKHHFIVNVSFNDHHLYFLKNDFDNEDSVIEFLRSEGLKLQSVIGKKLFQAACIKTKKVQVILDGLDEVCPEYEQKVFKMIEIISEMGLAGLYISTRPELKRNLEKTLRNFCHEFIPFSENDQLEFLTKFWRKKRKLNLSDDELQVVAEKAILLVRNNKLTEITGIPLITKMLAEIFDSNMISEASRDDSLLKKTFSNLSELYKAFVDKKIERYLSEKLKLDLNIRRNRRTVETEKLNFITSYKKMAIKLILSQYSEIFKESQSFEENLDELEDMTKCGLIFSSFEIKFIHRTIAEYFAYLKIFEKFNVEEVAKFVVQKIFCDDKFGVIRSFLNSSIEEISSKPIEELYGKILLESEDDCKKSMKTACAEKNTKIYDFIFKSLFAWKLRNVNSA